MITGKERDAETGLDYFGARYLSGAQVRFTSPDPITGTLLHMINPQRWNMYAYGLNNPLFYTDPDGRRAIAVFAKQEVTIAGVPFGHAGIVSVHHDGRATCAPLGPEHEGRPFDTGEMKVLLDLPKVDFGSNRIPTQASFSRLADAIGAFDGQDPASLKLEFFKTSDADTNALDGYFQLFRGLNRFGDYNGLTHNCVDFVACGLTAARVIPEGTHYVGIPNVFALELELLANATYQKPKPQPKKKLKEVVTSRVCPTEECSTSQEQ